MAKWHLQNLGEDVLNDINSKLSKTDVVDNLTSSGVIDKALSANQGVVLKDLINSLDGKINGIVGGMQYLGTALTYASITTTYPDAKNGDIVVVLKDENHSDARTLYVYTTSWQSVGDFEMAESFIKLTDTPDSYAGQKDKLVKVKSTADGLEFIDDVSVKSINNITPDAKGNVNITSDDNIMLTNDILYFSYTKGNDSTGDGTEQKPLQSIEKYLNKIRGKKILNDRGIAIVILDMMTNIIFDLSRIDLEMLFIVNKFGDSFPNLRTVTVKNGSMPITIERLNVDNMVIEDCESLVKIAHIKMDTPIGTALAVSNANVLVEVADFYNAPLLVNANFSSKVVLMACSTHTSGSIKSGLQAHKGSVIVYDNSASTLAAKGVETSQGGRVINGDKFPLEFVTKFSELSDVPNDYTGQKGKYVRVNTSADGLEFSDIDTYTKDEIDGKISGATPAIKDASITQKGVVQLTNDVTGESQSLALTQKGARQLTDEIASGAEKVVEHILTKASNTQSGHVTVDNTTIKSVDGQLQAINIEGLTVSPTDINTWLNGTTSNIQTQINNVKDSITGLVGGMKYIGTSATQTTIVTEYPTPENGDVVVVLADETHDGARTLYVYTTDWIFIGNFEMAESFVKLTDTPNSYSNQKGKYVRVNSASNGLEFADVVIPNIQDASTTQKGIVQLTNDVTGDSETLALTQKGTSILHESIATVAEKLVEHSAEKASKSNLGHVTVDSKTIFSNIYGEISVAKPFTNEDKDRINSTREIIVCPPKLYFSHSTGYNGSEGVTPDTPKQSLDFFLESINNKEISTTDGKQSLEIIMLDSNDPSRIFITGTSGASLTLKGSETVFSGGVDLVNCQNNINLSSFSAQHIEIADCSHVAMYQLKITQAFLTAVQVSGTNYVSMHSMAITNQPIMGLTSIDSRVYAHFLPGSEASSYGVVASGTGVVLLASEYPTGMAADILENDGKVIKI